MRRCVLIPTVDIFPVFFFRAQLRALRLVLGVTSTSSIGRGVVVVEHNGNDQK